MARSKVSVDFFLGFILLVIAVTGVVTTLALPKIDQNWRESSFQAICDGTASYYRSSELYNAEKKNYASNAKAFELLFDDAKVLRLVGDYEAKVQSSEQSVDFALSISDTAGDSVKIPKLEVEAIFSDGKTQSVYTQNEKSTQSAPILLHFSAKVPSDITEKSWEIGFAIKEDGKCLGEIPLFFSISSSDFKSDSSSGLASMGALNAGESGALTVKPGLSSVGFSDWLLLGPMIKKGITVLSYESTQSGKWVSSAQTGNLTAQPGQGYFLFNPSAQDVSIDSLGRYKVPQDVDSRKVSIGWNLLYNDTGRDAGLDDIAVSVYEQNKRQNVNITKHTLGELIKNNLGSPEFYLIEESSDQKTSIKEIPKQDLISGKVKIPRSAVFWFYLFERPLHDELTKPDISLSLEKAGDSFKPGDLVHLTFKIKNNDNVSHFIDAQSETDLCQMGLSAYDSKGKKIYDDRRENQSICPLWPEQIELAPSQSKDFTRDWQIPRGIEGEIKLRGYFDYTRLGCSDIIESDQSLKISDG